MKKHPWRFTPGENATIRFLDTKPDPGYTWVKMPETFKIKVPLDDAENILFHDDMAYPPGVKLLPHVKDWCLENLKGDKTQYISAFPRCHFGGLGYNHTTGEKIKDYSIEFASQEDAILFKLRWIGTPA